MALYWNGTDITEYVTITGCVHRDVSGGRSDSLELTLDHASIWYKWDPQNGDEIIYTDNDYTTGKLYLNSVMPDGDQYRILATSLKPAATRKAWEIFAGRTLGEIMEQCAAECGMESRLYGIDKGLPYPFVVRQNVGCAAFLNEIGEWEGLAIKALNGAFRGISVAFAQGREPLQEITITSKQAGVTPRRRESMKFSGITVQSPYASATAIDTKADSNNTPIIASLPAMDNAQAGRWARGLLLMNNRRAWELEIEQNLNLGMGALTRINITGDTDQNGAWIVDQAEHDFINRTTTTKLLRVIDSIV